MLVFVVAAVLVALVLTALVVRDKVNSMALCPRRQSVVEIVDGRCRYRTGDVCALAPLGCERECIPLGHLVARAG